MTPNRMHVDRSCPTQQIEPSLVVLTTGAIGTVAFGLDDLNRPGNSADFFAEASLRILKSSTNGSAWPMRTQAAIAVLLSSTDGLATPSSTGTDSENTWNSIL